MTEASRSVSLTKGDWKYQSTNFYWEKALESISSLVQKSGPQLLKLEHQGLGQQCQAPLPGHAAQHRT